MKIAKRKGTRVRLSLKKQELRRIRNLTSLIVEITKLFYKVFKRFSNKVKPKLKQIRDRNDDIITHKDKIFDRYREYLYELLIGEEP